jgi:hypothetical protein
MLRIARRIQLRTSAVKEGHHPLNANVALSPALSCDKERKPKR